MVGLEKQKVDDEFTKRWTTGGSHYLSWGSREKLKMVLSRAHKYYDGRMVGVPLPPLEPRSLHFSCCRKALVSLMMLDSPRRTMEPLVTAVAGACAGATTPGIRAHDYTC